MSKDQKSIYFLLGENLEVLKNSPTLEKFSKKGYDVLLLSDEIDGFVMPSVGEFDKTPLKDITSKEALEEVQEEIDEKSKKEFEGLIEKFKSCISDNISEFKLSKDLDSPLCLLTQAQNPMMANLMAQMGQSLPQERILELNITHPIITKLKETTDEEKLKNTITLLYGNAKLLESGSLGNAQDFCNTLNTLIEKTL